MNNLTQQEIVKKLQNEIREVKEKLESANQEIETYKNNIKEYNYENLILIEKKRQLEKKIDQENEKRGTFEEKIRQIVERWPSQILIRSLRNITQSVQKKAKDAFYDFVVECNDAYKDYNDNLQTENYQQIFESFYIIGIKTTDLKDIEQNKALLTPKFIYKQYKETLTSYERDLLTETEVDIQNIFGQTPIQVEKLQNYDFIEENIKRFIFDENVSQQFEDLYFINLKAPELLFQNEIPKNMDMITSFNRDKQLFLFVLAVDDYVTCFQQDRYQFWKFKKFYCYLTYFPIAEIYDQILILTANIVKAARQVSLKDHNTQKLFRFQQSKQSSEQIQNEKIYQDLDAVNIVHTAKETISSCIQEISKIYLSYERTQFQIDIQNTFNSKDIEVPNSKLSYSLPKQTQHSQKSNSLRSRQIMLHNKIRHAHFVMQIFSFEDFFFIFMEILKEGKIIFFSQNSNILTSICYFFHQIIYPFIWVKHANYQSDKDYMEQVLKNHLGFILGVNEEYYNIKTIQRYQKELQQENVISVELIFKKEQVGYNITSLIHGNQISQKLPRLKINEKYNQIKNIFSKYRSPGHIFKKEYSNEQAEKCIEVLQKMINIIENDFIFNIIPEPDPAFVQNNILNLEFIKSKMKYKLKSYAEEDKKFILDEIFRSTYFETYLKHIYTNQPKQK